MVSVLIPFEIDCASFLNGSKVNFLALQKILKGIDLLVDGNYLGLLEISTL